MNKGRVVPKNNKPETGREDSILGEANPSSQFTHTDAWAVSYARLHCSSASPCSEVEMVLIIKRLGLVAVCWCKVLHSHTA